MSFLRSLGLGKIVYQLWHRPLGQLRLSIKHGGPLRQWQMKSGCRQMEKAAATLPSIKLQPDDKLIPIHYLTGDRFWYQTAFCIWSYARFGKALPQVIIHDDGSLKPEQAKYLSELIPELKINPYDQAQALLRQRLPKAAFPHLNRLWHIYPNIRKLIDPHLMRPGSKLVLDSDMLFHAAPDELLSWQREGGSVLLMKDAVTSYGYGITELEKICGQTVDECLNVGVCGIHTDQLDWKQLESWCSQLINQYGHSYYLEQALVAMLAAGHPCHVLTADDYRLESMNQLNAAPGAVLRHYVDRSKGMYFRDQWQRVLI